MKLDPYKHKERYLNWKAKALGAGVEGLSTDNSKLLLDYVFDMEKGLNVSVTNKKGSRSYPRLNNLRQRLTFMMKSFQDRFGVDNVTKISEADLFSYFTGMRNGEIKTNKGKIYKSVADYIKVFKAFWHWHM
ncbi:hypothetical protein GF386_05765, partial [Candidatus Pacearchaeota archaeon]|nr:hypothetical protein [Candidatus Pacearchaeota archaeon]MBD3283600.1 hypothetical protein [Candidatus Pacearchaeota archaeon]